MKHLLTLRRLAVTAVTASAVAMAIGGISLAHAGGHSTGQHRFALREVQAGSAFVSISHTKAGKPGDGFIFHSKMFRGHRQVGTLDAQCTLTLSQHAQCVGTFSLPGGTLSGTALTSVNGNAPTHVAINGGTGRYARARGQVVSYSTGQNTSRDVFTLSY